MHRAKIAWSSEDVADEYELQLQHELEMLQVNPGPIYGLRMLPHYNYIFSKNSAFWRTRERQSINSVNFK